MLRDIGQTFPQCVSFQEPYSDRKLRSALLWLTSSMSASMEGECVRETHHTKDLQGRLEASIHVVLIGQIREARLDPAITSRFIF